MTESEREATLRRLWSAVTDWEIGFFEHDYRTGETYASPRFRELLGFAPDEVVGMQELSRLTFPADVEMIRAAIERSHDPHGNGVFQCTYRVVRTDGQVRWIDGRGNTTFEEVEGQRVPVRATGSLMDVTESQELKLAVERQERRLTQAITCAQVGVFDWDHEPARPEDAVYWSPTYREISGYDPSAAPDIDWYVARVHPEDIGRFRSALADTLNPLIQAAFDVEYRWLHPDGEWRWCVARSSTSFRQKGPQFLPSRTVGAVFDITSTKRAAEQLAQRSAILEATPDLVCITDPEMRLVYLNQAGRRFARIDSETDASGVPLAELLGTDFGERVATEGRRTALSEGLWQVEADFMDHAGRLVPFSVLTLPHRDSHGQLTHFSFVARDLSRESQLQEQFRQAQKMEAIGKLAGGVAHDFNNLLSVILGFSELLAQKLPDQHAGQRDLREIIKATERAAALTSQLLAFSRKQIRRPRVIDVNELLGTTGPMLQRLIDESVEMKLVLAPAPARIKADPNQIEQVLLNLVVNARDAMPEGGVLSLEVSHVTHQPLTAPARVDLEAGHYVVVSVSDTGHGMSAEVQDRIFDPFFTTKEQGKGTGLGLATVFGIVQQSGGDIWLHSEVDQGTTFQIYLPSTDEVPEQFFSNETLEVDHAGGTILLVEDEPQLRRMLNMVLTHAGYRVLTASGPVEALGVAKGYPDRIDLLLTDVVMPQMTGTQLASELVKMRPGIRVLMMSGHTEDAIVRQGVVEERINFLPKPIGAERLLSQVARTLKNGQTDVA